MAEKNTVTTAADSEVVVAKAKDFWARNSKVITALLIGVIVGIGGYFGYKNFVKKPKETNAINDMYRAEAYFRIDSFKLALDGDGKIQAS